MRAVCQGLKAELWPGRGLALSGQSSSPLSRRTCLLFARLCRLGASPCPVSWCPQRSTPKYASPQKSSPSTHQTRAGKAKVACRGRAQEGLDNKVANFKPGFQSGQFQPRQSARSKGFEISAVFWKPEAAAWYDIGQYYLCGSQRPSSGNNQLIAPAHPPWISGSFQP